MEWTDDAIVLSARPHGETAALAVLLTRGHGRHAGLVHGGQSGRMRPVLEPGNRVAARWAARLVEQLGTLALELERATAAGLLEDPLRLAALSSACALVDAALPEREPHPALFDATLALFDALQTEVWAEIYVRWEIGLLEEAGFGLDFGSCAATGITDNDQLAYVSPRTGRAVSLSAGEPYRDRLLALPPFLVGRSAGGAEEVVQGLALTGHFLDRHLFALRHAEVPAARTRFVDRYRKAHTTSGITPAP
ncbi:DNA repair protein RecO [Rhodospirillum centenum]|uniref:DNA repair protein RecO n=1 Tax=Rhodospirillum centenum (strain ATCC 51521 / SW) TaxID=414684 RepID=RECO_RHOCS|nr:DNA repair protein RecO [Rhodospirillum centenum]B6IMY9.1 RecName: Full=DNA repair protein RecO; AltName: Full=Recombination protein O [Rhodospirillum centenum SW]ACI98886.1 DNA repair protein RecO, putative [Rhodospirillum centenum SW]